MQRNKPSRALGSPSSERVLQSIGGYQLHHETSDIRGTNAHSVSPFFPSLEPRSSPIRGTATSSPLRATQQAYLAQTLPANGSKHAVPVYAGWSEEKEAQQQQQYQQTQQLSPAAIRHLGASQSTMNLGASGVGRPSSRGGPASMRSSASASSLPSFPVTHGGTNALDGPQHAYPYPVVLAHSVPPVPAPSNASAKLAVRLDRWHSVEELLDHSHAVLSASSAGAETAQGPEYNPALYSTFSSDGSNESQQPSLVPKATTPLQRKALAAQRAAAHAASSPPSLPVMRSPFSTTAPPPLPPPPQPTWGGLSTTPTAGLAHATALAHQGGPQSPFGAEGAASQLLARVGQKMRSQDREDRASSALRAHPAVLLSAGLSGSSSTNDPFPSSSSTTSMAEALITAAAVRSGVAGKVHSSASVSAAEKLWQAHQHMMSQARSVLSPEMQRDTRAAVVAAVQSLHPRTLLSVFSPQLHVLSVSLGELAALVKKDDKEKATLLTHLVQHQTLIMDVFMQFVTISCQTLQNDGAEADSSFDAIPSGDESGQQQQQQLREIDATLRSEAEAGMDNASSMASLLNMPNFASPPRTSSQQQQQQQRSSSNVASPQQPSRKAGYDILTGLPSSTHF